MAVASAGCRGAMRLHVPRVRFAVQDGYQPPVLSGTNTEGQTVCAAGVHQRGYRGRPGREPYNDRASGRGGLCGR